MDPREISAETTTERESSKLMETTEPMEESPATVTTCLKKRKAESDFAEETDESGGDETDQETDESEDSEEERTRVNGPLPQWDVDSFDGREYDSSEDVNQFSDKEQHKDKLCREFKRQIIANKGFYVDPELISWSLYSRIKVIRNLDRYAGFGLSYREYFEELTRLCLKRYNQENSQKNVEGFNVEFVEVVRGYYRTGERSKSYITFLAKEKPHGPLVEYQAKTWSSYKRGENYPILCRPALRPTPMAKPS